MATKKKTKKKSVNKKNSKKPTKKVAKKVTKKSAVKKSKKNSKSTTPKKSASKKKTSGLKSTKKAKPKKSVAKKASVKKVSSKKARAKASSQTKKTKSVGGTSATFMWAEIFTPLDDRLVVAPIEKATVTTGGIFIPDSTVEASPNRGKVLAVGRGHKNVKGHLKPMDVKVGDEVLFNEFATSQITILHNNVLIIREKDVLGVVE